MLNCITNDRGLIDCGFQFALVKIPHHRADIFSVRGHFADEIFERH